MDTKRRSYTLKYTMRDKIPNWWKIFLLQCLAMFSGEHYILAENMIYTSGIESL